MIYSEASYAGPDHWGNTFAAYHFHHIGRWTEHRARKDREARNRQLFARQAPPRAAKGKPDAD